MSGKETLGFLTESSLLPKKARDIGNVGDSSLLALKSIVFDTASKRAAHTDEPSRRHKEEGDLAGRNTGVDARIRADAAAQSRAARGVDVLPHMALKSLIYEIESGLRPIGDLLSLPLQSTPTALRKEVERLLARHGLRAAWQGRQGVGQVAGEQEEAVVDWEEKRHQTAVHGTETSTSHIFHDADLIRLARRTVAPERRASHDTGVRAAWEKLLNEDEKQYLSTIAAETAANRLSAAAGPGLTPADDVMKLLEAAVEGKPMPAGPTQHAETPTVWLQNALAAAEERSGRSAPAAQRHADTDSLIQLMMQGRADEVLHQMMPDETNDWEAAVGIKPGHGNGVQCAYQLIDADAEFQPQNGPTRMEREDEFHSVAPPQFAVSKRGRPAPDEYAYADFA